jgi:heptosyltransferase-2
MKFSTAAVMDLYVGRMLTGILSILPPFPSRIEAGVRPERLLIIKFWGFGSILQATPLSRALREYFPDVILDLLTFSENKAIAESVRLFDAVKVIDMRAGGLSLFLQTFRFILNHRKKYSMVIDLEFFAHYSALVTKLLACPYALGFDSFFGSRNRCYSRTIIFDHSNHIRLIFLKFLDALHAGPSADFSLSSPFVPEEIRKAVLEKLPGLKEANFNIAININTSELCENRRWPLENFKKLISLLRADVPDAHIYLIGGKEDAATVKAFHEALPDKENIVVTAGNLDLLELTCALSFMALLVTNDSGPLHLAEAVGAPVVGFFGPETPNLYGPLSAHSLTFYRNLFCSPCLNTYNHKRSFCTDNQCLRLISADDVYEQMKARYFPPKLMKKKQC